MIPLGVYGIRIVDIFIPLIFISLVLNNHLFNKRLLIFLSLLFISVYGSVINGYINFGIAIKFQTFFSTMYRLIYIYTFYHIANKSKLDINSIIESRILRTAIIITSSIVLIFMILPSLDQKFYLLNLFWSNADSLKERLNSTPRFPGLGNNINIFSYTQLIIFHFAFNNYLKRNNSSWLICLLTFFNILTGGSRKALLLLGLTIMVQLIIVFKNEFLSRKFYKFFKIKIKHIKLILILPLLTLFLITFLANSNLGSFLIGNTETNQVSIFSSLTSLDLDGVGSGRSTLGLRLLYMYGGIQRIMLSPFFGIPRVEGYSNIDFISFSYPHNEFIQIWTLYGFISFVCLISVFFYAIKHVKHKNNKVIWLIFLLFTFFQATVDTMFLDYQSLGIFLIFIGNFFAKNNI